MKRKIIGKIVFINGRNKYVSGKELKEYKIKEKLKKKILLEMKK